MKTNPLRTAESSVCLLRNLASKLAKFLGSMERKLLANRLRRLTNCCHSSIEEKKTDRNATKKTIIVVIAFLSMLTFAVRDVACYGQAERINRQAQDQKAASVAPVNGGTFLFVNTNSGRCLSVKDGFAVQGPFEQMAGSNERWKVIGVDSYFKLIHEKSGKLLAVPSSSKKAGIQLIEFQDNGFTGQQWSFVEVGKHYYIKSRSSGFIVAVGDSAKHKNAKAIQWEMGELPDQIWRVKKVTREGGGEHDDDGTRVGKADDLPEAKAETTSASAIFKSDPPDTVRQYLENEGLKTDVYKRLDGERYGACSSYKMFGKGTQMQTNIAYYIEGNATSISNVHLTLNVNSQADRMTGNAQLLAASLALAKKATGLSLPPEVRKAIEAAKNGEWKNGDVTFKVSKVEFENAQKGYSLTFKIE